MFDILIQKNRIGEAKYEWTVCMIRKSGEVIPNTIIMTLKPIVAYAVVQGYHAVYKATVTNVSIPHYNDLFRFAVATELQDNLV